LGPNPALTILKVSPNPTDGNLKIEFEDPRSGRMVVEVYNIKGEKIFMKEFKARLAGSYKEAIDISTNPKGMYFIRINNQTFKDAIILK
jgi:hypothetical protein